ncbi:hypothetical protein D3C76_1016300 [compost metagenome]
MLDRQPFAPDGFTRQAVTELVKETATIGVALVRVHVPADVREKRGWLCERGTAASKEAFAVPIRVRHRLHDTAQALEPSLRCEVTTYCFEDVGHTQSLILRTGRDVGSNTDQRSQWFDTVVRVPLAVDLH